MTIFETVSIFGLFIGPLLAVALTLWVQNSTRAHDRRLDLVRKLLDNHHDASQHDYSSAIRLIPIEFRHDTRVLDAWRSFMENVGHKPTSENQSAHNFQYVDRKFRLIYEVCRSVKIKISENEIRTSVYEAQAYTDEKMLIRDTRRAIIRIADEMSMSPRLSSPEQESN